MDTITLLKMNEIFSDLQEGELQIVTGLIKLRTIPKNVLIINEGDSSDAMYLIKEGKVDVMTTNEKGEQFVFSTLKEGDNFGELSLLDGNPRSASVLTLEKCVFAVLHKDDFRRLIKHSPGIVDGVVKYLCNRIRFITSIAQSMALMDVYGRLTKFLLEQVTNKEDGKLIIGFPYTKQTIAAHIGCRRESVSRIFNDLKRGGYLIEEDNRIIINKKFPNAW